MDTTTGLGLTEGREGDRSLAILAGPDRFDLLLAAIAFSGCLLMAAVAPRDPLANDGAEYAEMASNLLAGRGYMLEGLPYAYRPPGYALFVALFFRVFGHETWPIAAAQALMTALTPLLLRRVLRAVLLDESQARAGALAQSLYVLPSVYVQQLLTEPLATFLVLLGALVAVKIWSAGFRDPGPAFLAGVLCAAPALVKSNHVCLFAAVVLCGLYAIFRGPRRRSVAFGVVLFALGGTLVFAPWAARNMERFGRPYLLGKSTAGRAFLMGLYQTRGQWLLWTFWDEESSGSLPLYREFKDMDQRTSDLAAATGADPGDVKMATAWEQVRADPGEAVRGYLVRAYSLWLMIPTRSAPPVKVAVLVVEVVVLLTGIAGWLACRRSILPRGLPVVLLVLSEAVLLPIIHIEARYAAPLKPFLLAGVGILAGRVLPSRWPGLVRGGTR